MKILLIKLNHLGDTLLLTPTIDFLAARFPHLQLDVMVRTGCEMLLQSHPAISNIIRVATPEADYRNFCDSIIETTQALHQIAFQGYDYAFALSVSDRAAFWSVLSAARCRVANNRHHEWKRKRHFFNQLSIFDWTHQHQVLKDFHTVADQFDRNAQPGPLSFFPKTNKADVLKKFPLLNNASPLAVIHPTSRWAFKQWIPERWAMVADYLSQQEQFTVGFTSGPAEVEKNVIRQILASAHEQHVDLSGRTNLDELARIQSMADIFLGVDTLAMHLAAAMQTPSVALFGPSSEWSWHPWQCRHELVLGDCPCKKTRVFTCDKSRPYPCMEKISVAAVLSAANRLLHTV